jgi:oxygen-independent coproporphyrinogen-3 oxidase
MGLYLHIPFCRKACHFCDFHFTVNLKGIDALLLALQQEAEQASADWKQSSFDSVYLGGGTPGLLGPKRLGPLLEHMHRCFTLNPDAEITLETNPDDLLEFGTEGWKALGINRLSLGVQTLNPQVLANMNRAHTADQARRALDLIEASGIPKVSVDLMFGMPGQGTQELIQNAEELAARNIQHVSIYGLTVEKGTALERMVRLKQVELPEEDEVAEQYLALNQALSKAGFEHYEVSNYARNGQRSLHNSAYWSGEDYLGLGPSAHSLKGDLRWFNRSSNAAYVQSMNGQGGIREPEELNADQKINEWLLTRMRTVEGLGAAEALQRVGAKQWSKWLELKQKFPDNWFQADRPLAFSPQGWLMMDGFLREAVL